MTDYLACGSLLEAFEMGAVFGIDLVCQLDVNGQDSLW